jgi:Fur family ferric uptake transcriptional regulator
MAQISERQTRQRTAIRDAIEDAGAPVSPKEILELAQSRLAGLGMATVYRTLKLLAEAGVVQQVEIPGESPRYELAGKAHHHHFYCRPCGRVFEVEGCPGDFADLSPKGFTLDGHELVLFGSCDKCTQKAAKEAGKRPAKARPHQTGHTRHAGHAGHAGHEGHAGHAH